jgi:uncharacterized protein (TIGR00730 family)
MMERIFLTLQIFFKLVHSSFQQVAGVWRISKLKKPVVTIFGGARLPETAHYFKQAQELAQRFARHDISVLTGGGPGVMQAASCGVEHSHGGTGKTMGIGVKNLEGPNVCVHEYFEVNYFFARKWLLTYYSQAFIIFPGGYGTLDELSEVLTLIHTKQLKYVPIVLIGVEYWDYFMRWIETEALEHGLIERKDLVLFTLTDDLDVAYRTVVENYSNERPADKQDQNAPV